MILFFLTLFLILIQPGQHLLFAQSEVDSLNSQIVEYQNKLNELSKSKDTLANQIKIFNSQVQLTLLKITQSESQIKLLEQEISNLSSKIGDLNTSLNQLSSLYVLQVNQNYKLNKKIPIISLLMSQSGFNQFLEQYKYLAEVQNNSQNTLLDMETVRSNYDTEKNKKIKKTEELELLKKTLATQKKSLNDQIASKNKLLEDTKNDEKKYQQLLSQALSQLAALKNFSSSAGGSTCLSSVPSGGSDGNFYSQRDPRWCGQTIGNSSDTIGAVGCYLTSMSMVYKKIGVEMTPSAYAAIKNNFWANTAYMNSPVPPSGYTYKQVAYNTKTIDEELKAGRYVIAQMKMNNIAGMHFIVIISGSGGNYKIHDPWFGADLNFSDRYSPSLAMSLRLITK